MGNPTLASLLLDSSGVSSSAGRSFTGLGSPFDLFNVESGVPNSCTNFDESGGVEPAEGAGLAGLPSGDGGGGGGVVGAKGGRGDQAMGSIPARMGGSGGGSSARPSANLRPGFSSQEDDLWWSFPGGLDEVRLALASSMGHFGGGLLFWCLQYFA